MAQTGARHGLAFAFPLLDRRVVEYAMSLPSELFVRDGFRRRPFRDAMAGVLPERVRWRHEKYMPFPGIVADLAEGKSAFLSRIDAYEKCERVRRTLDLARLRKLVNRFPSFDGVREDMARGRGPAAMGSMAVVMRAMRVAAYIEQHGDDDGTDAE
ncbi:MAG: asparagine synthase-related protein [Rhizomicrobium sp.]